MYHGIGEPADPAEGARYTVSVPEWEAHLEALSRGARVVDPLAALGGAGGVVLTFDDGERTVLTEALPRMAARGFTGALFVTTAWLGRPGYLLPGDLRAFRDAGWVVGSHGHTHRFLSTLGDGDLRDELAASRDRLAALLGEAPRHLALPGGRGSPRVDAAARALGLAFTWTSEPGANAAFPRDAGVRRTAIRRGIDPDRFRRLAAGDPIAHLADRLGMGARGLVRRAVGEERYHRVTARVLELAGRR
jgi:peptidoglycan/xylan/chitin deacetylase (PgdA/CDA1 family)